MKSRSAFTLIELLTVVAIIVLLLALLIPALDNAQEHARMSGCKSNLRNIAEATFLYAADNFGHVPYAHNHVSLNTCNVVGREYPAWANQAHDIWGGHGAHWQVFAVPYLHARPGPVSASITKLKKPGLGYVAKVAKCPSGGRDGTMYDWSHYGPVPGHQNGNPNFSYGFNRRITGSQNCHRDPNMEYPSRVLATVRHPMETHLVAEIVASSSFTKEAYPIQGKHFTTGYVNPGETYWYGYHTYGKGNVVYVDGHVGVVNGCFDFPGAGHPDRQHGEPGWSTWHDHTGSYVFYNPDG